MRRCVKQHTMLAYVFKFFGSSEDNEATVIKEIESAKVWHHEAQVLYELLLIYRCKFITLRERMQMFLVLLLN